jgi:hypothetical protein
MNLSTAIDRLAEIKAIQNELDAEKLSLEAIVQTEAEKSWVDKKYKTVAFRSDCGNKVTVTRAKTVKTLTPSLLKNIFGRSFDDMVNLEESYKVSAEAKRLLGAVATHEYCQGTVDDIVDSLNVSTEAKKSLKKKLKGKKFETDVKNLVAYGIDEELASDTAYLISEIVAWNGIENLLKLNDMSINDLSTLVQNAVGVSYTIKVCVDD